MTLQRINRGTVAAIGFTLTFGLFAVVTTALILKTQSPAINAVRAEERAKALAEIKAAEVVALASPAIIDAKKGIVRLPIETAMAIAARKAQDPAAFRADLKARVEKANAVAAPETFE